MAFLSESELATRILYRDADVLVVDKPWGIPTTGLSLDDTDSVQWAVIHSERTMTWAVHQLDADTSGVNVFALRKAVVPVWQQRMRAPTGRKIYLAVVHGEIAFATREVATDVAGKPALSRFTPLCCTRHYSLVKVEIHTGRTHQIRVHAEQIGHPLVGEKWYRTPRCDVHPRQALHAWQLRFADGRQPTSLCSPVPGDLLELLGALGLDRGVS
ncbi:MAG: RNA pseudouridine synthase [Planctomycetes bacterium]|nr:RNA pseudouridine synthase [Planctomycetota bacterium]